MRKSWKAVGRTKGRKRLSEFPRKRSVNGASRVRAYRPGHDTFPKTISLPSLVILELACLPSAWLAAVQRTSIRPLPSHCSRTSDVLISPDPPLT